MMVWSEMKQLDVHLSPTDYERMPYWVSELILTFLSVQREYVDSKKDNATD